ncbi:TetR/AcrR family transcriptional regulator [Goodfellowiella coeruleoviolacea]|nr:TetR/AcrR family transcriptional regulator [Goodfellowiella coeruleoviolacea]
MPEKRRAIIQAARLVFGRDGYSRASVDAIAAEAGVSKRTIYNHFDDKADLFQSTALEGAVEVTQTIAALMDRHLRKIVDLEEDLIAFSVDRAAAVASAADHFALVRAIHAEAGRIPRPVLEAWQEAGPRGSNRHLAGYLRRIADQGLLAIDDEHEAANYLTLLTFIDIAHQRSFYGAIALPESEVTRLITHGVRAFLRLYRPE